MIHEFHKFKNVHNAKQEFKKILIHDKGIDTFIHPANIIYIELHSNMHITYFFIETANSSALKTICAIRGTLVELEKILPSFFYRISRKCLLNTCFIEKINGNEISLTISSKESKQLTKILSSEKKKGLFELISLNG